MKLVTNVAGVTFDGRQDVLRSLYTQRRSTELRLEPDNRVNPSAVAVYINGRQVGYIPDDICDVVHDYIGSVAGAAATIEYSDVYYVRLAIDFMEDEDD